MGTEVKTSGPPGVDKVLEGDGSAGALVGADGPVLLEGGGAVDGGLVGAGRDTELVGGAVGGDGAAVGGLRGGVVVAEVLDDVVLDEGVAGPAVDGEVGVAVVGVGSGVGDHTKRMLDSDV